MAAAAGNTPSPAAAAAVAPQLPDVTAAALVPPLPPKTRTPSMASIYDNHVPDLDSPPLSPLALRDDSMTSNNSSLNSRESSPLKSSIAQSSKMSSSSASPRVRFASDVSSDQPIKIPIRVRTDNDDRDVAVAVTSLPDKRTSPERFSTVSSVSSRSSSFSLTASATSTSQTVILPPTHAQQTDAHAASIRLERELSSSMQTAAGAVVTSARQEQHMSHVSASRSISQDDSNNASSLVAKSNVAQLEVSSSHELDPSARRLSEYDNFSKLIRDHQNQQFASLTDQIKQLTVGVDLAEDDLDGCSSNAAAPPPPLPAKTVIGAKSSDLLDASRLRFTKRPSLISQYDNFDDDNSSAPPPPPGSSSTTNVQQRSHSQQQKFVKFVSSTDDAPVVMRGSRSNYEFAHKSSAQGNGYARHEQVTLMKSSQTVATMSSYGGDDFSADGGGGGDIATHPPPLPPKRKNGRLKTYGHKVCFVLVCLNFLVF